MGVPAFYRWLADKYPLIVVDVIEDDTVEIDGITIPINTSEMNPNGIEFDNLYLDMNGIIHPCFHPEDRPAPTTLKEVFLNIYAYIDRLFAMVRPRKILYMAIDGVAPRAKMNQQRSRRFRAAKDAAEAALEEERLREEFAKEGRVIEAKVKSEAYDSNVITPGTEFMFQLSVALQYYIHLRMNEDQGWKNVKVILSDANSPGEGEHKVMNFIRLQRNLPGYNPNTRHCIYGLDADLIMLALATHELHFSILREVVFTPGNIQKCFLCGQEGHLAAECEGKVKRKRGEFDEKAKNFVKKPFQFLHIWILREYLEFEFQIPGAELDLDRVIDDFVFICFFVGNDFLPHMPTLEIREGAINLLMSVYKKEFSQMNGYLTYEGEVDLEKVEHFIRTIGSLEDTIFKKRARIAQRQNDRRMKEKGMLRRGDDAAPNLSANSLSLVKLGSNNAQTYSKPTNPIKPTYPSKGSEPTETAFPDEPMPGKQNIVHSSKLWRFESNNDVNDVKKMMQIKNDKGEEDEEEEDLKEEFKLKLKNVLREKSDLMSSGKAEEDSVKLGEEGWKERYYRQKFHVRSYEEMEALKRDVVFKYVEGLCWVMRYYYQGVCSWNWYYPYHYAPFASDLINLSELEIQFFPGKPFKPFDQLMGVLPAASSKALPIKYRELMTNKNSPILDFYPDDFQVDMNGKRFAWQGVALLPFIDESRLLKAIKTVENSLTDDEKRRNSTLYEMLYISSSHSLAPFTFSFFDRFGELKGMERENAVEKIDPAYSSEGMNGFMKLVDGNPCPSFLSSPVQGLTAITNNQIINVIYINPKHHRHVCRLLKGVKVPPKLVSLQDVKSQPLWHEEFSRRPYQQQQGERPPIQGTVGGAILGAAANRLLLNSLQKRPESAAYEYTRNYYQGQLNQVRQYHQNTLGPVPLPRTAPEPSSFGRGRGYSHAPSGSNRGGILNVVSPYSQRPVSQSNQSGPNLGLGVSRPKAASSGPPIHVKDVSQSYAQQVQWRPVNGFFAQPPAQAGGMRPMVRAQGSYQRQVQQNVAGGLVTQQRMQQVQEVWQERGGAGGPQSYHGGSGRGRGRAQPAQPGQQPRTGNSNVWQNGNRNR